MIALSKGRYTAAEARCAGDIEAAQRLRALCFELETSLDVDPFDATSKHILIRETASDAVVCCFRMTALTGAELPQSYAAQFYELSALAHYDGLMMELGRFCIHPDRNDPDILRLAWAALTSFVDTHEVKMLFGCSSFAGVETAPFLDTFAMLKARHLAPKRWLPRVKAPDVFRFAARLRRKPDAKKAMLRMPPLLRTYLMMGGWVSDHAVVDHQMNTLHVFTGVEIGAIPAARKRLLRALV
ncbi:GNAT family N-acetyltransferase [Sulfitobacter aestuariivivens]|uniref:L-ornithine N(alpha)-acyltransferase n=1 Tax=Sulfitobacter aestuariivivens TaxID=2766981 RepID=A0A927HD94_9RHOB|nr:GNAT family N-acyltransferase [Sulfitobacter aestuariivivens]MBD3663427.1 GNAT family N-acetyltransferase [Sulfitobacter aestuariivivens]